MEITVAEEAGRVPVTILQISGPITDGQDLQQRAQELFERGARNLLLDLAGVPYMATAGLRALHVLYTLLRSADDENDPAVRAAVAAGTYKSPHLKLLSPSEHVAVALQAAGYDMFLEIHHSRKPAIASF